MTLRIVLEPNSDGTWGGALCDATDSGYGELGKTVLSGDDAPTVEQAAANVLAAYYQCWPLGSRLPRPAPTPPPSDPRP